MSHFILYFWDRESRNMHKLSLRESVAPGHQPPSALGFALAAKGTPWPADYQLQICRKMVPSSGRICAISQLFFFLFPNLTFLIRNTFKAILEQDDTFSNWRIIHLYLSHSYSGFLFQEGADLEFGSDICIPLLSFVCPFGTQKPQLGNRSVSVGFGHQLYPS